MVMPRWCQVRDDPSLRVAVDDDTGQTLLHGMGELHLEVVRMMSWWCHVDVRTLLHGMGELHLEVVVTADAPDGTMPHDHAIHHPSCHLEVCRGG